MFGFAPPPLPILYLFLLGGEGYGQPYAGCSLPPPSFEDYILGASLYVLSNLLHNYCLHLSLNPGYVSQFGSSQVLDQNLSNSFHASTIPSSTGASTPRVVAFSLFFHSKVSLPFSKRAYFRNQVSCTPLCAYILHCLVFYIEPQSKCLTKVLAISQCLHRLLLHERASSNPGVLCIWKLFFLRSPYRS